MSESAYRNVILADESDVSVATLYAEHPCEVAAADLILMRHPDGRYSVLKDQHGETRTRVPFDELSGAIKTALPRRRAPG